ncbi:MAG TPA: Ig-like domain-containing protein [Ardenticatenaceae bacterium]|jgi:DNA-binding beta-propeller fold protein YncE
MHAPRFFLLALLFACFWLAASGHAAHSSSERSGPGLGNLQYEADEVMHVISTLNETNGAPRQHGTAAMHNGYLAVIYSMGGDPQGGFSFYDISNPRAPRLVARRDDAETRPIREAHGYGFSYSYPGQYVVLGTSTGLQFWDWSDVTRPVRLSELVLPGVDGSDYAMGAWWVFWQAPYVYVGGSGNGIYIVDASDPSQPVLVERAGRPNPIPISQLGGFRVGPIYAVGNLLVISNMSERGYATLDISDPINPVLLHSEMSTPVIYSILVNGNQILGAGADRQLHLHDITDPSQFRPVRSVPLPSTVGYLTFQDGFAHVGASTHYAKVDLRYDGTASVATGTSGLANRDEDFASVVGNLVVVSDDHGNGSFLIPHQAEQDRQGPTVNMVVPADGSTDQALTTRLGLSFTDQIDLRSVTTDTLVVRPLGGPPVSGKTSHQTGIVNFSPDEPLQPGTTYEVLVPAGGIRDYAGNPVPTAFVSRFTTRSATDMTVRCSTGRTEPAQVGASVAFTASATGSGALRYAWDFGDGSGSVPSADPGTSHTYSAPGHYAVRLTVTNEGQADVCSFTQTIYYPPTATPPAHSTTITYAPGTGYIWAVNPDNDSLRLVYGPLYSTVTERRVGDNPRTVAVAPTGDIWVANQGSGTISVLENAGRLRTTILLPRGSQPYGVAFSPNGSAAYVTLQATGRLLKIDPATYQIVGDLFVGPTPRGIAISGDSQRIFVSRFISSDGYGEVTEVNGATFQVVRPLRLGLDPGPDTEASGRGLPNYLSSLTISPDGRQLWIPSKKDNTVRGLWRDGQPLTFESTVRTIVSQVDLTTNREVLGARLDLNDRDMAVAVAFSPLGDYLFVATQGSNSIEVFDAYNRQLVTSIPNVGLAPQGLMVSAEGFLFVQNFMSRSIAIYDVTGVLGATDNQARHITTVSTVDREALPAQVLAGKQLFYNAADPRMNRDGYISCASCHLDGGQDGRVWDFTDRGEGLRNTTSLIGHGGTEQGPLHWSGNFDEVQDFEHDIRGAFGGSGFMADEVFGLGSRNTPLGDPKAGSSAELDALAAYLRSLSQVSPSPHRRPDGFLTPVGLAGQRLFNRLGCDTCHAGPEYTDSALGLLHDVGTLRPSSGQRLGQPLTGLDTPTLQSLWETAPYLHDGSAASLRAVFTQSNPQNLHGVTSSLSSLDLNRLVAYLNQLDESQTMDDGDARIRYNGWTVTREASASGGAYHFATATGESVTYRATQAATSLAFLTYRGPDQGQARVYIDGVDYGILDLYASAPQAQVSQVYTGLPLRVHTITVIVRGRKHPASTGTDVRVDGFRVDSIPIDDEAPAVSYSDWAGYPGSNDYGGSYRAATRAGASITSTIRGSQFTFLTQRGPHFGQVAVYVDGVRKRIVDLYSPVRERQVPITVGNLSAGAHSIRLEVLGTRNTNSSGNTVVFDGLNVP